MLILIVLDAGDTEKNKMQLTKEIVIKRLRKYRALNSADGEKAMLEILPRFEEKQVSIKEFVK